MAQHPGPICIIGAGIIGASAALHLIESGARDVTIIDAGEPLSGTTPAGAGFVARFGADHNRRLGACTIPLQDYGLAFYKQLHESGQDIDFAANGNLVLARTSTVLDTLADGILGHPQVAPRTRRLDADGVAELMRGAVDPAAVAGGVYMPEGIQLTTALAQQAILTRLEDEQVQFHWATPATGVRMVDGSVTGVETSNGTIDASTIVLAGGAWNQELLESVDRRLPLIPMVATRFVSESAALSALLPTVQCPELRLWLRELHGAFSWGGSFAYRLLSALEDEGLEFGYGRPVSQTLLEAQFAHQDSVAEVFPPPRPSKESRSTLSMAASTLARFLVSKAYGLSLATASRVSRTDPAWASSLPNSSWTSLPLSTRHRSGSIVSILRTTRTRRPWSHRWPRTA